MGYPTKLLGEEEQIEIELHPHWKALIFPVAVLLVAVAAGGFVWAEIPSGDAAGWLRLAVGVVVLLVVLRWTFWPWLRWITTQYVITNRRLIVREGVITRDGRDMPLSRINDVSFSHDSLLERMLGCGTLIVESGGERGQLVLGELPRVEETQRELYELVEADATRRRREMAGEDDEDADDIDDADA